MERITGGRVKGACKFMARALPERLRETLRGWLADLRGLPRPRIAYLPRSSRRRIVIDAETLRHPRAGIGTYTYETIRSLLRLDEASDYYLMNLAGDRAPIAVPRGVGADGFADWLRSIVGESPQPWRIPPPAVRGADIYFGPCFFGQFHPSFRTVLTIPDTCYQHYPDETCPTIHPVLLNELPRQARQADAIVAISQSTRADVVRFLGADPAKVRVIFPGVHPRFRPIADYQMLADVRRRYRLPPRFVLAVGTLEPRKNLVRLCQAFRLMRDAMPDCSLVLTGGKGWKDEAIRRALEELPARSVTLTGYVPDDELPALYNLAEVLAYPSLYEGFGLPVAEAMACGTPAVTSDRSSLPEVAGDAAVLVDPLSVEAIAAALLGVLGDAELRSRMRRDGVQNARRFCWDQAGGQLLALFDEVGQASA